MSLCGELELRNGLYQDFIKTSTQEVAKKMKNYEDAAIKKKN